MQQIGGYEVLAEIARGGMGVVFRAQKPGSGRLVAIKVLISPDPHPRFLQEFRSLARLEHPGIVALHEVGQDHAGRGFMVMELVEGESLQARIKRDGPLPIDEARGLILQLCDALSYAHHRGVIHRDLKPSNVLMTHDGRVKLVDFGLGRVVNQTLELSRSRLTRSGDILGTPAYMPPEQASGQRDRMGPRSDVYSLGATLYALLTGKPPFEGESMLNVLYAVLDKPPSPPSQRRADVLPELDAIVLRCLEKEPADRFESVGRLAVALRGEAEPREDLRPAVSRSSAPLLAAAGIVMVALGLALALLAARKQADPQTTLPSPETTATSSDLAAPEPPATPAAEAQAQAALERGKESLREGRSAEAVREITEAIRLAPDYAEAYHYRGVARGQGGDHEGAIEDCTEAIRLQPDHAEAHAFRANARGNLGDFQGAIEDYTEVVRLEPGRARAYAARGVSREILGDYRGSIEDASEAIQLDPDNAAYGYYSRGFARGGLRDWRRAIEDWQRALEMEPNAAWAPSAREEILRGRQQLADQGGGERGSGDFQAEIDRGLALSEAARWEQARRAFDEAIRLQPDHARAYAVRGVVRRELGDHQGAVEDSSEAIRLEPDYPQAYYNRGFVREELGDYLGAIDDYSEALRLEPDHADAHAGRGRVRHKLGDFQGALEDWTEVIRLKPLDPMNYVNRGAGRSGLGDWQGAIEDWERALELDPDAPWVPQVRRSLSLARQKLAEPQDGGSE